MNIKNRLRHIADMSMRGRRLGKTTAIAKAVKDLDGIMLCRSHQHAKDVQRQFGVTARSMEMNLHGFNGPFMLDHYALEELLYKAVNKIETLEKELEELKK